jgi:AAA15 family ATPase/GTPase
MIKSLHIENLKGFEVYDVDFGRINLLVGGNNCGKTTIFHAMNVFPLIARLTVFAISSWQRQRS